MCGNGWPLSRSRYDIIYVAMQQLCVNSFLYYIGHGPFSHMFERIKWIPEEATKDETTKDEATKDDKPNELKVSLLVT